MTLRIIICTAVALLLVNLQTVHLQGFLGLGSILGVSQPSSEDAELGGEGQRLNCAKGHDFPLLDDIGKIINLPAACNVLVCLLNITCQYQCNDKLTGDASELIKILIFPGICDDTKDRFGRSLRPCVDDGVLAVSKCLNAAGKPTSSI